MSDYRELLTAAQMASNSVTRLIEAAECEYRGKYLGRDFAQGETVILLADALHNTIAATLALEHDQEDIIQLQEEIAQFLEGRGS